jgi:hypothetical protein
MGGTGVFTVELLEVGEAEQLLGGATIRPGLGRRAGDRYIRFVPVGQFLCPESQFSVDCSEKLPPDPSLPYFMNMRGICYQRRKWVRKVKGFNVND